MKNRLLLIFLFMFLLDINIGYCDEVFDDNIGEYKVYINDNEVSSYDLIDDTKVKITQVYNGGNNSCMFELEDEFIIDYSNKLYGEYVYDFSLVCDGIIVDTKNIVVNYIGNNDSIINSNGIYYIDNNYYILGDINKEYTSLDIINLFNKDIYLYDSIFSVINKDGIKLLDNELVSNGDILKINGLYDEYGFINMVEDEFIINFVFDSNGDGIIDVIDIRNMLINKLLNVDINNNFDILDIVKVGNNVNFPSSDILKQYIENDDIIFVGDELELKYYIDGFVDDSLAGIMGDIIYDKEILELTDIIINSVYGSYNDNGSFVYLLDDYRQNGLFITFKFRTLKDGTSSINLDNLKLVSSSGDYFIVEGILDNYIISIIENGKGGDSDEDREIEEIVPEINNNIIEEVVEKKEEIISKPVIIYEELSSYNEVSFVNLSSDNYIEKLNIVGYEINFDKNVFEYNIHIDNKIDKLDFEIDLSHDKAYYLIEGNRNFDVGDNRVIIKVTSEDGNNRNYVINVHKSGEVLEEVETIGEDADSSKNVIILLIVLIIIGLFYLVFFKESE